MRRILSNILDMMGKRLIGLYDVTLFGGLPGLWIMIILGEFPQYWEVGKSEYTIIDINIYVAVMNLNSEARYLWCQAAGSE